MKLTRVKEIEKMEILDGNFNGVLPYELTVPDFRDDIEFAIEQLKKYPKLWNLRRHYSGLVSIFVDYPTDHIPEGE